MNAGWAQVCVAIGVQAVLFVFMLGMWRSSSAATTKALDKLTEKFEALQTDHQETIPVLKRRLDQLERNEERADRRFTEFIERSDRRFNEVMEWLRTVVRGNVPQPFTLPMDKD
jgi:biopolymer transport protein ExbB/TolQ